MKIFISYSSKNNSILKLFVEKILRLCLRIEPENISCTGIENSRPESGKDFKEWIKTNIINADIIIQLISIEYKESEVCLNEMGASWVADKRVFPLLIEDVNFYNVGFIHDSNQLLRLDSKENLHQLVDELCAKLGVKNIKTELVNNQIDSFLEQINLKKIGSKSQIKSFKNRKLEDKFIFFEKFLQSDIDTRSLIEKSQPNIYDCKKIFRNNYAIEFYKNSFEFFLKFDNMDNLDEYNHIDYTCFSVKDLKNGSSSSGGMQTLARDGVFRSDVEFYAIHFQRNNEEVGFTLPVWCYINDRWIFLPKPWRVIRSL